MLRQLATWTRAIALASAAPAGRTRLTIHPQSIPGALDTPQDTGMSPRLRRAIPIFAVAITAVVVAATLYLRPVGPSATVVYPSPSAVPTLSAQYSVDFDFITPSLGWALIAQSLATSSEFWVYRTTDGTRHWHKELGASAADQIPTFRFFDRSHGIVMTGPVSALRTDDGGATWTHLELPPTTVQYTFTDPLHAWAITASDPMGTDDHLMTSADGGATWTEANWPVRGQLGGKGSWQPAFRPDGEGWLGSTAAQATVMLTTDGGRTWTTMTIPGAPVASPPSPAEKQYPLLDYTDVELLPGRGALATVTDPLGNLTAYVTLDLGATWRAISQPPNPTQYSDFAFLDSKHWWAFRFGYLFKTSDAGVSWKETKVAPLLENWRYQPVHVIDATHGWSLMFASGAGVAGAFALSMTSDGGVSWHTVKLPQPG